jgi:hypothetical protein
MKKALVFALVGVCVISVSLFVGLGYATPIEKPWKDMSCDKMLEFALSPNHNTLEEKQHLEFHKDLELCVKNKK